MRVSHVHTCTERLSSTLSSPFQTTSSSPHFLSISCSHSCTSSTTFRAAVTLRTSPGRRWTLLTNPTSSHIARVPSNVSSSTSESPGKRSYGNLDPWSVRAEKVERSGKVTIIINSLLKVLPQQAAQSGMKIMLGLFKSAKRILRCANDRETRCDFLENDTRNSTWFLSR